MATYAKFLVLLIAALIVVGEVQLSSSQKCGCAKGLCCSKYGYCGTSEAYCGAGCRQGPCSSKPTASPSVPSGGSIESIITRDFFNRIKSGIPSSCKGSNFYTYNGFISAAKANNFAGSGTTGSVDVRKRVLAAFFANVAHETTNLCYVEEIAKSTYCRPSAEYPCARGKQYYGRGPLQLTWNYNYGAAGKYVGLTLLNNPDLVGQQADVAFKTSLWFWMVNSNCHKAMTSNGGNGFRGTIRAINGVECGGGRPAAVQSRVSSYQKFCRWLGVPTGPILLEFLTSYTMNT